MRGKRRAARLGARQQGITPAHAGKTLRATSELRGVRDHPRACGENFRPFLLLICYEGSPPRMRGKQLHCPDFSKLCGITPAHAGKTLRATSELRGVRDHPRACGENSRNLRYGLKSPGSPPRMRGKLSVDCASGRKTGITPAHAGKTMTAIQELMYDWDHPRACGENQRKPVDDKLCPGSPPRMRGKHFGKGVFPWLILVLSLDPL